MSHSFYDLKIGAPARLRNMRAEFAGHAAKYPYCPEHVKPKTWRDVRTSTLAKWEESCCTLAQGFNGKTPVWYCHTGPQFRNERFADSIANLGHNGWYTNEDGETYRDGSGLARGIVAGLTHGRFIAGYHWGDNGERVYFLEVFTDETDAAQMADEHARVFAENEQEYNAKYNAMQDAEREIEEKEQEFKLAFMARHVSADHAELAREALEYLRSARCFGQCHGRL